ncbi:MAG: hypothetical protein KC435_13105 [Thermomicrobiales bacterium]|nr:hypothetical protein [Thermomicrobiales bacterium]
MNEKSPKSIAIIAGVVVAVVLIAIVVVLYLLGGDHQSALEKLRDIAIIFSQLLMFIIVVLLAAITAALIWLAIKIKDQVMPMLDEGLGILREFKGTATRVSGTTSFVTEEAVKPIVTAAGQYAKIRKMGQIVTGKSKAKVDPPTFSSKK